MVKRLLLAACAAALVLLIAVVGLAVWCMNAPAIPYSKMERMRIGMTEGEVAALHDGCTHATRGRCTKGGLARIEGL